MKIKYNYFFRFDNHQRGVISVNAGTTLLFFIVLTGLTLWLLKTLAESDVMPIKRVQVEGQFKYTDSAQFKNKMTGITSGGFFNVDVSEIENAVRDIDWIRAVSVRRVWPDTIRIQIEEQKVIARWNKKGLLNKQGEVFYPGTDSIPPGLPELAGPEGLHGDLLTQYKKIKFKLEKLGLRIKSLKMDDRHTWRLALDNGIGLVMGRTDIDEALHRFIVVYNSSLSENINEIANIDLRYTNGFAVRWKSGTVSAKQISTDSWRGNI